jgi:aspartyl-tRNA(Asn)/glutamyl-tRNA(Gln) amidotransferase subunit B
MQYEPVIGIEVHAQLDTESKMFCACGTSFAAEPNSNTCPVCLGLPGSLPVANKKAIEFVIRTALALNCEVPRASRFARKNYYYPDLPKAYQISQYELPIGLNGYLDVPVNGEVKRVRINRVHLEEDTGKLIHDPSGRSLIDYNRVGTPLMEIVTEADIHDSDTAAAYLMRLRAILQYIGVSRANMEKGQMRCEPNISIRPVGQTEFGTKTELKNLNSFKTVQKGIAYEVRRQQHVIEDGGRVIQETRGWNEAQQLTFSMRVKEKAHDYRYFPDPDLMPLDLTPDWVDAIRQTIPELPDARLKRFMEQYSLPEYDAEVLTAGKAFADYFETVAAGVKSPKTASNWIMTELMGLLNETGADIEDCKVPAENMGELLAALDSGAISGRIAKDVFREMFETGRTAGQIIKEKNLVQVSDERELAAVVDKVIADNPGPAQDVRDGKDKAIGFLVGQAMKLTKGKGNPQMLNRLLRERLGG